MKTCQGQLSSQSRTPCICSVWSELSKICKELLQIAAKPGYVQSWLILQIKAEFKSIDLHHLLVCYIFCIKHNGPTHSGSLVRCGDSCISLLWNHVLACISIVGVKKLPIFLHKTIAIWPTDQMHQKLKSPSISLCLPT